MSLGPVRMESSQSRPFTGNCSRSDMKVDPGDVAIETATLVSCILSSIRQENYFVAIDWL
jgi:hypothetical protein